MGDRKKLDQVLSVIVILLYVVVVAIKWIMLYQDVAPEAIKAISIISTVIQCLMICVVLYNALGAADSWIFKIIFIVVALFLIVSTIAQWIPTVTEKLVEWNIPVL